MQPFLLRCCIGAIVLFVPLRVAAAQPSAEAVSAWNTVIARTDAELSIIAPETVVPADGLIERGFRVLAFEGPIPFTTTGVIAAVAAPLAEAGISLLPIATYDTDYVMVKDAHLDRAISTLRASGWTIEN